MLNHNCVGKYVKERKTGFKGLVLDYCYSLRSADQIRVDPECLGEGGKRVDSVWLDAENFDMLEEDVASATVDEECAGG